MYDVTASEESDGVVGEDMHSINTLPTSKPTDQCKCSIGVASVNDVHLCSRLLDILQTNQLTDSLFADKL